MNTLATPSIKLADEVWLSVLMLHLDHKEREDFSIEEIMEFAKHDSRRQALGTLRPGFYAHVVQHCVANRPPSPARYRLLLETGPGRRRLFRPGDPYHPEREGGKSVPQAFEDFRDYDLNGALKQYGEWCRGNGEDRVKNDPLLALRGSGKHIWADEDADTYIRRLREGWE
jgi:hypothetical protein